MINTKMVMITKQHNICCLVIRGSWRYILIFDTIPRFRVRVNLSFTFIIDNNHFVSLCIKTHTTLFSCDVLPSVALDDVSNLKRPFVTLVNELH